MENAGDALERQNAFYETIREELEAGSFGKWAVVSSEKLVGVYDSNREASEVALKLASDQACLVKHVGYVVGISPPMLRVTHVPLRHS